MALRTKTIEYPVATNTATLALATRRDTGVLTMYIPETSSRTFRSVRVEVTLRGDETVAASMTSWLIGIKLGGVAFSDVTTTITLTNSGDPQSHVFERDVTAYFNTNFGAGTSQTYQVGLQFGALATANHTIKLIVTYEYDDTSATTRIRTARFPLASPAAALTAALATFDTTPNLATTLPESGLVAREIWLEFTFNCGGNATTDFSLGIAGTGGLPFAETVLWRSEQALNGGTYGKAILNVTGVFADGFIDFWSATCTLQARSIATATRFSMLAAVLCVTYEYNHSTSTRVLNSLVLPAADEVGFPGNTTTADQSRFDRLVFIEEPGTITMVQSGLLVTIADPGAVTLNLQVGAQTSRAYVMTAASVTSGPYALTHRIDSGSINGAALTLARGRNIIQVDRWTTLASTGSNFSAMLYLNYTSDIHADGDGVHNHSTSWGICEANNLLSTQRNISAPTNVISMPEANNYRTGLAVELTGFQVGAAATGCVLQAEYGAGEGPEGGWCDLVVAVQRSDGEAGVFYTSGAPREEFRRWTNDPDDSRMALETSRQYRICTLTGMTLNARAWVTYHAITYAIAGTVTGSAGGTVTITAHRTSTGEKIASTSRSGNGAYSMVWYDNTENVYTVARESGALLARSDDGLAA